MKWFSKNDPIFEILKEKFGEIKKDFNLKNISYIKIGGKAKYFYKAQKRKDLVDLVIFARKLKIPHVIIGNASNVLFKDEGFDGLVIKNDYARFGRDAINVLGREVVAPSGMRLLTLVKEAAFKNLGGIEFLAGIPGTIGGAIVNNASAFSKNLKDYLDGVYILNKEGEEEFLPTSKLGLSYRGSIFKGLAKKSKFLNYPIILEAKFILTSRSKEEVLRLVQSLALIRKKSQPQEPSLGCVFKNPLWNKNEFQDFVKEGRISAGFLIDKLGLKGKRRGRIKISELHANFFVNLGRGKSKDYIELIEEIKERAKERFGIILKEEIEVVENC